MLNEVLNYINKLDIKGVIFMVNKCVEGRLDMWNSMRLSVKNQWINEYVFSGVNAEGILFFVE